MKDWLQDSEFLAALRDRHYIRGNDNALFMSGGSYLYMYELFLDGAAAGMRVVAEKTRAVESIETWRIVVEHWKAQGRDLRHLEVPPELASQLGVPLDAIKERRRDAEEEDMAGEAEGTAKNEPKWKKRREFDGEDCGYQGCTRSADGYVVGIRSTKEGKADAKHLWYGPACTKCVRSWHSTLVPLTLAQLAEQRNGVSDLAAVLDLEVGEVQRRLAAAGVDDRGRPIKETAAQAVADLAGGRTLAAVFADHAPVSTETLVAQEQSYTIAVVVPFDIIEAVKAEATQTLSALENFFVSSQEQMDYASSYLQRVKGLTGEIETRRKAISKPFRKQVEAIQSYFKPAVAALQDVEAALKAKIQEGYQRAQALQAEAFQLAEAALGAGDSRGAALATQQAVAADIALSAGISARTRLRFEIVDPSQLPSWAWSPDPAKVQAAIDAGWREIPGVRIWEEQTIAARAS